MFSHNPIIKRVQLNYELFATQQEVRRIKTVLALEKGKHGAKRAVLRILTDKPIVDDSFLLEAEIKTAKGTLAYFGCNSPSNSPCPTVLKKERQHIAAVISSRRRPISTNFEIVRLEQKIETAAELENLFKQTYSFYPESLDEGKILKLLSSAIPYAVIENGKIVSALFGTIFQYGPLTTVEYNYSATGPSLKGISMTTALAARIRKEAIDRFNDPLMIAETIAAPVMFSCHQLGMEIYGILPQHYRISTGGRDYTNFYLWSL